MFKRLAAVLAIVSVNLALSLPALSQPSAPFTDAELKAAASLRDRALRGTKAFDLVASLTSEIGPRLAGSDGDRAAVAWALSKMNDLGFQNVQAQTVQVPRWVRGPIEATIVGPWPQPLIATALGGSVGTSEDGIKAEVVLASSLDALKKLNRSRVQGKIVFINQRTQRTRDGSGYGAAASVRRESRG